MLRANIGSNFGTQASIYVWHPEPCASARKACFKVLRDAAVGRRVKTIALEG